MAAVATPFVGTGLRATTDAGGRWAVRATGQPIAGEFLAVTADMEVPSYASEPLIGPELYDAG